MRLSVLLPHKLGCLTYASEQRFPPGTVVAVPLGGRTIVGVVWDDAPDERIDAARLKRVASVASDVTIPAELRRFVDFFARYTLTPRGAVMRLVLRNGEGLAPPRMERRLIATGREPARMTDARRKILQRLAGEAMGRADLLAATGVSAGVIQGLVSAGALREIEIRPAPQSASQHPAALTPDQRDAVAALQCASCRGFKVTLLEGVTGSGKTEVYLEAVAATLAAGGQALILMPEIALTPMIVERLTRRFGRAPGEWHSQRSSAHRTRLWRSVADGEESVVVGARSALFLPFSNLGLVVVDEEHDASFKQEDTVIYHARDMAIARAKAAKVPVVLVSATPSLETRLNAEAGRYARIKLAARYGAARLPDVTIVDLRAVAPDRGEWLAPPVRDAVTDALGRGEQALLFLNRRGYAPLTVCRACGYRATCPNCSASLVDHRLRGRLVCHHCGHNETRPAACPECHSEDTLVACGPGVERVSDEASVLWPDRKIVTVSSDMPGGPQSLADTLSMIANGDADIIVGTQLVAKGYTFPKLQLVVVVDADIGLMNGDPRAAERTFQLLTQVAGRAGRVAAGGRAIIQTHAPDHPAIAAMAAGDAERFYAYETSVRAEGGLPPFCRLAAVIVSAADRSEAWAHATALARTAPGEPVHVLGPAEAPLALLRGRYRFRLLASATRSMPLQEIVADWLAATPLTGSVRRAVDVDPQSFL